MYLRSFLTHTLAIIGLAAFLLLTHCSSAPKQDASAQPAATAGDQDSNLLRSDAQARKARLDQVKYVVSVTLSEKADAYTGKSEISFQLKDASQSLRVDFFEGRVSELEVNGQKVPTTAAKKYWIELPATSLKVGANTVKVSFSHDYSHQGQGLHKFTDPQTKQVFLYSQFESFDANRFMPCFDQPDLRSTFTLTVEAPHEWQVISTTRELSVKKVSGGNKVWTFPETPAIATYLFSLHAGPYKVWTDKFEDIPLRLFVRPSLAKYVHPKEWFQYTKAGLKFYNDYFAYRYPFKKYDQLIVPEFNAGAMENVGAVTFSESYIPRSEPTRRNRRNLAGTLLHEMAHMWFGDIVTMAWWDDLWLNESFASYMSSLSVTAATEYKEEWQSFFAGTKSWAYWEDGLLTTHPIEANIASVKEAETNFDGITYGKGASVLKQLAAYMGPENFQKGVQAYFKTYAFKNTTLPDFIGSLQTQSKHDLVDWAGRWLKQSGTDKIAARWTCEGDRLKSVAITATPMKPANFRPQALQLALFTEKLTSPVVVPVDLNQPTVTVTGDWACPAFVYPNYQDDGYARVSLDAQSLKFAKANVHAISETLLRTMVWSDLWEMVRETEMSLNDYIQVVNTQFPSETDEILLGSIVGTISGGRSESNTILNYWPKQTDQEHIDRLNFIANTEAQYLKRFNEAKRGSDDQKFWFDSFVTLSQTPKGLAQVAQWANGKDEVNGMKIDLDRRWNLARHLARYASPDAPALVAKLQKADNSDRGHRNALSAEAIRPELAVKQKWVTALKEPKPKVSLAEAWAVLGSLFPLDQRDLAKKFQGDFFEYLKANGNSENEVFVRSFVGSLMPLNCDSGDRQQLSGFLTEHPGFSPSVVKELKVSLEEDERCQKIRAASHL